MDKSGQEPQLSQGNPPYEIPKPIMRIPRYEIVRAILDDPDGAIHENRIPDTFKIIYFKHDRSIFITDPEAATDPEIANSGGRIFGTWKDVRIRLEREPRLRSLLDSARADRNRTHEERIAHNAAQNALQVKASLIRKAAEELYDAGALILMAIDVPHIQGRYTPANDEAFRIGLDALRVAMDKANGVQPPKFTLHQFVVPRKDGETSTLIFRARYGSLEDARNAAEAAAREQYGDLWEWCDTWKIGEPGASQNGGWLLFTIREESFS